MLSYITILNSPIVSIFTNFFLITSILLPSIIYKNISKLKSFGLMINFTSLLIINNVLVIILIKLNKHLFIDYIFIINFIIAFAFYIKFKKKYLIIYKSIFNNLIKILKKFKILLLNTILLLISTFIVALDGDSYMYHLSFPIKLIINNFEYTNPSWFHTNLVSYAEINNLYGLIHGSDNYVSFLNFTYFIFFIMFLVEYFDLNKINYNLIILFVATPFFYFLIVSQKFFFGPFLIISLFIFYFLNIEYKFSFKYLLVFNYAILTKITFYFYPFIFFIAFFIKNNFSKDFKYLLYYSLLSGLPLFIVLYLFRIDYLQFPLFPFIIDDNYLTFLFNDWVSDQKNFLKFKFDLFFNIFFPTSFYNLTNFLGIFVFYAVLIFFIPRKIEHKVLIIIMIIISIFFFQTSPRFYFIIFFISLFFSINYINIKFSESCKNSLIFISYFQNLFLILTLSFSIYSFGLSILSSELRDKILISNGYDYIYFKKLNSFIENNSLKGGVITYSRSNLFSPNNFSSIELISSVITTTDNKDRLEFINYLNLYDIKYIYADHSDYKRHSFIDCISDTKIFETGNLKTSARNPTYEINKNFQLYKLKKDITDCF